VHIPRSGSRQTCPSRYHLHAHRYAPDSTAYIFLDIERKVLVRSQDATFDESCIACSHSGAKGHNTSIAPLPYVPMPLPFIDETEDATPAINAKLNTAAPEASRRQLFASINLHIRLGNGDDLPALIAPPADTAVESDERLR